MRYLALGEVVELHARLLATTGGASGIRDLGLLESALAQPRASFVGVDLHASLTDKAAALGFSLVANHPFVDGNKRVGHAAMETFLVLNGHEIDASVDEQESVILQLASAEPSRDQFTEWLRAHVGEITDGVVRNPGSSAERG